MPLAKGSQAVKLENHIAWGWTKGDWGRRKLVNIKWLELWLRTEWSCWERGKCWDVEEIFGASLSGKGTLNSALINLKEQELLEVKVIQACYPRVQSPLSIEAPFPRGNFRSRMGNETRISCWISGEDQNYPLFAGFPKYTSQDQNRDIELERRKTFLWVCREMASMWQLCWVCSAKTWDILEAWKAAVEFS